MTAKVRAMFEDCQEDMMDQLWGSYQCAGAKQAVVTLIQVGLAEAG